MKVILVIDDEINMVGLVKGFLIEKGYRITYASSGNEGLDLVKKVKPNLILLDLLMPVMDGFEVLRNLKVNKDTRNIPVIILTSSASELNKQKCLMLGAVEYLEKSFSEDILVKEIEKHITQTEV